MGFVFVCAGAATGTAGVLTDPAAFTQQIALTFGFCITVLAYTIGHYSGGHINCAVTLGLVVAGACEPIQGALNFIAQLIGAIVGAALIALVKQDNDNPKNDGTGGLGTNKVATGSGIENYQAMFAEIFATGTAGALTDPASFTQQIALTFGFCITVLALLCMSPTL